MKFMEKINEETIKKPPGKAAGKNGSGNLSSNDYCLTYALCVISDPNNVITCRTPHYRTGIPIDIVEGSPGENGSSCVRKHEAEAYR